MIEFKIIKFDDNFNYFDFIELKSSQGIDAIKNLDKSYFISLLPKNENVMYLLYLIKSYIKLFYSDSSYLISVSKSLSVMFFLK